MSADLDGLKAQLTEAAENWWDSPGRHHTPAATIEALMPTLLSVLAGVHSEGIQEGRNQAGQAIEALRSRCGRPDCDPCLYYEIAADAARVGLPEAQETK